MDSSLDREHPQRKPPRTATVLVFLAAAAVIFSYIGVYAVPNALVAADVMSAYPAGADPRPGLMLKVFGAAFAVFAAVGMLFRYFSNRQLKALDAMADAD